MLRPHWQTWWRFGVWLVIGLASYFSHGRKHALMNPNSPRHDEQVVLPRTETQESAEMRIEVYVADAKVTVPDTER